MALYRNFSGLDFGEKSEVPPPRGPRKTDPEKPFEKLRTRISSIEIPEYGRIVLYYVAFQNSVAFWRFLTSMRTRVPPRVGLHLGHGSRRSRTLFRLGCVRTTCAGEPASGFAYAKTGF